MPEKKKRAAPEIKELEERIGYRFKDPDLLDLALTHRSHGHEAGRRSRNNEALEFLGDAILGFVVADELYRNAGPSTQVGTLARRRSGLVSELSLSALARERLDLGAHLKLGKGEAATGGRDKKSLLADAFEAIVAAIYLDGGITAARRFISSMFPEGIRPGGKSAVDDPKTELQERLQAKGRPLPVYKVASSAGPDHRRSFTVDLLIGGKQVARGEGRSKKGASIEAARQALKKIGSILKATRSA